ncbi:DUF3306 domain-containing protein [Sagittula salina]|uniref:DUF3306 domain-containing protein n=1 Tax=Sagittula salina TaxID=2820268 RepID=A0A940MMS1_9RHOB|nr:DUF3306 domain-containing protein [Sagittula salina]MBP0484750.1 DUF3306 domain-containing protein [Sagittula salina]
MSSFWERRKAAVAAENRAEAEAREAAERQAAEDALAETPDAKLLEEAGLPEPEKIESIDQLQAFLKSALPQRLKTRALRHHWGSNPVLANLDGLLEYGEDYTDAARCVPDMKTLYQVGKGMFDKVAEAEAAAKAKAEAAAKAAEAETATDPETVEEGTEAVETEAAGQGDAAVAEPELVSVRPPAPPSARTAPKPQPHQQTYQPAAQVAEADDTTPAPAPRRMRFRFDAEETRG